MAPLHVFGITSEIILQWTWTNLWKSKNEFHYNWSLLASKHLWVGCEAVLEAVSILELWLPRKIWKYSHLTEISGFELFFFQGFSLWCACVVNWREPQCREVSEKSIKCFREVWAHWNYEGKKEKRQSRWKVAVKFMPGDTMIPENLGGKCTWQGSASTRGEVLPGDPPPLRSCPLFDNYHPQEDRRDPAYSVFCQKFEQTSVFKTNCPLFILHWHTQFDYADFSLGTPKWNWNFNLERG